MTVRALQNQEAQHLESGAIVRTHGRFAVQFQLDSRVLTIHAEHGVGDCAVYLGAAARWDDGEPLGPQTVALLEPVITEIMGFWGISTLAM